MVYDSNANNNTVLLGKWQQKAIMEQSNSHNSSIYVWSKATRINPDQPDISFMSYPSFPDKSHFLIKMYEFDSSCYKSMYWLLSEGFRVFLWSIALGYICF